MTKLSQAPSLLEVADSCQINMLPNSIKSSPILKAFKACLKDILTAETFYSTDEFIHGTQLGERGTH